jgi:hypothetical protein
MSLLTDKTTQKILWESIKEPARLLLLGLISFSIVYLTGAEAQTEYTSTLLVILRFADKILHEVGKVQGNELKTGLTRF